MAIRNLRAIVNRYTAGAVSPNYIGSWLSSIGATLIGDAQITAAVAATVLTVSAVSSGALAVGSLLTDATNSLLPATTIKALGTGTGGVGTYVVAPSQTVLSEPMTANGTGIQAPAYTTYVGVPMNVQAVSSEDLRHLDSVNLQETNRVAYLNVGVQGVQRPAVKGGDILQIPTGLSGNSYDVWLCKQVLEAFDIDGWVKVLIVLQMPSEDQ